MTFTDLLKQHTDKLHDEIYKSVDCLLLNFLLATGTQIEDAELVVKSITSGDGFEYSWSVRKKINP